MANSYDYFSLTKYGLYFFPGVLILLGAGLKYASEPVPGFLVSGSAGHVVPEQIGDINIGKKGSLALRPC